MKILCLLFSLCYCFKSVAQEDEKIKDIIESLAERLSGDEDLSELTERLSFFLKNPINLNKANQEQLKSLIFLSPLQISSFFSYIAQPHNKLLNVLELQAIPSFDPETINKLLPFVVVQNQEGYENLKIKSLLTTSNHDLLLRYSSLLQQRKGFRALPGSRYLGSPEKVLLRYRYNFSEIISAALVMEKDAGEHLLNRKTGTDHLSAHIALFKLGVIKKLVAGDYSLQFGQGLTLWSGFSFGKGPDVTSVASKDVGLKPYTSANESSFFRGIAGTVDLGKNINLTPFVSFRKLDASLKLTPEGTTTLSNINISGLHRTKTELKNQRSLEQRVYGGALQYLTENLNVGLIIYQSAYEHPFSTGTTAYKKYSFTGKHLTNTGIHYNYTFKNIYFYGEFANSIGGGTAIVNGAMASISPVFSAVILHRNYEKDYHSFFSRSIGEATETSNEQGWYAGLNYLLPGSLTLSIYGDYFKFPWLKYRVNAASSGYELLSQLAYKRGKTFKALLRFKREQKQQNPDAGANLNHLDQVLKQSYRLEWNWKANRKFNFQQRTEIAQYQKGMNDNETGYMIYQDLNFAPMSSHFSANIRLAYFNTPSYNSRIYAYENNVLYGASSGVYSGKGLRTFVNTRYKPVRQLDIWLRYALSLYHGVEKIGSGLDEIEGNKKSELTVQCRYQF